MDFAADAAPWFERLLKIYNPVDPRSQCESVHGRRGFRSCISAPPRRIIQLPKTQAHNRCLREAFARWRVLSRSGRSFRCPALAVPVRIQSRSPAGSRWQRLALVVSSVVLLLSPFLQAFDTSDKTLLCGCFSFAQKSMASVRSFCTHLPTPTTRALGAEGYRDDPTWLWADSFGVSGLCRAEFATRRLLTSPSETNGSKAPCQCSGLDNTFECHQGTFGPPPPASASIAPAPHMFHPVF